MVGNKLFVTGMPTGCRKKGFVIAFLTNSAGKLKSRVVPDFLDIWIERLKCRGASSSLKNFSDMAYLK